MGFSTYRHNYEEFCKIFTYPMTAPMSAHVKFVKHSLLSSLPLLMRALKKISNLMMIVWISIDDKHLNNFKNSFNAP